MEAITNEADLLKVLKGKITKKNIKAITEYLKTLTSLDLYNSKFGVEGAKALAEALKTNETLTSLYLGFNKIEDKGAKALAEALKTNETLTSLYLCSNKIRDEGAKAFAEVLKTNKTLTSLDLRFNKIGDKGAKIFGEALVYVELYQNREMKIDIQKDVWGSTNISIEKIKENKLKELRKQEEYLEIKRQEEYEQQLQKESERKRQEELEQQQQEQLEREEEQLRQEEERKRQEELEQQFQEELERRELQEHLEIKKQEALEKQQKVESGLMTVSEASFHNTEEFQDFLQAVNPGDFQEMSEALKGIKESQSKYEKALKDVKGGLNEILEHSGLTREQITIANKERAYIKSLKDQGEAICSIYYSEMQKQFSALFQASVLVKTGNMTLAMSKVCKVASAVSGLLSKVPGGSIIGAISDLGITANQYVKVQKLVKLSSLVPDINSNIYITEEISRKSTISREAEIREVKGKGKDREENLIKFAKQDVSKMMKYILGIDEKDKIFRDKNHFIQVALNVLVGREFVYISPVESEMKEPQPDVRSRISIGGVENVALAGDVENLKGQFEELKQHTDDAKKEKERIEKLEQMMTEMMEENKRQKEEIERQKEEVERQKKESERLKKQIESMSNSQGGRYSVITQSSTHRELLTNVIGGGCGVEEPALMSGGNANLFEIVRQHSESIAELGVEVQNGKECQDLLNQRVDRLETPKPKILKLRKDKE